MVRYYSDDGVFEASVEKVWKLVAAHSDDNVHHIHAAFLKQRTREERPGVLLCDVETRGPDGRLAPLQMRLIARPPRTTTVEFLAGAFAGSWYTNVYVGEGSRTRVIASGDFRVAGVEDPAAVLKIVSEFLDHGFEEDAAYLRKMA